MIIATMSFLIGLLSYGLLSNNLYIAIGIGIGLSSLSYIYSKKLILIPLCFILGYTLTYYNVNSYCSNSFPENLQNKTIAINGSIVSMPICKQKTCTFDFQATTSDVAWQGLIRLTWYQPKWSLVVGQNYSLQVNVLRPRNYANPGSIDIEKIYMLQNIQAIGTVQRKSANTLLAGNSRYSYSIERLRQYVLEHLQQHLVDTKNSGIIIGLVMGVKKYIPSEQLAAFIDTGTMHLLAISGLHVGIIATLAFFIGDIFGRFTKFNPVMVAAIGSVFAAFGYSLLAGFAISTKRALVVVMLYNLQIFINKKFSLLHIILVSMWVCLLLDPLSVNSPGFWLSFGAILVLWYAFWGVNKVQSIFSIAPQCKIFIGMLPISIWYFGKLVIISPVANLFAIPWFSLLTVPLVLIASIISFFNSWLARVMFSFIDLQLELVTKVISWLQNLQSKIDAILPVIPIPGIIELLLGLFAAVVLLLPKGLPYKNFAWLLFLPTFFPYHKKLQPGEFSATFLDVGQGLSVIVQTANHSLVYDAGLKKGSIDMGSQVVVPYLRAKAISKLDHIMISHPDNDHIGGVYSILKTYPTSDLSINEPEFLDKYYATACVAGQNWQWDGIEFKVLYPNLNHSGKRNNNCCVLKVSNGKHSVLLSGDIEKPAEAKLIKQYGEKLHASVLLIPHHGSNSSSSNLFIDAVNPNYAVISAGFLNKYRHPHKVVVDRYLSKGVDLVSTVDSGASSFLFGKNGTLHLETFKKIS